MINKNSIDELNRDELFELTKMYAKNWLAHDGCWFLAIEKDSGMEKAIELDTRSWEQFTVIEAKKIKQFLGLENNSGLQGLKRALAFRLYATINQDKIEIDGNTLTYYVETCRVQTARERKKLDLFPCKPVGIVEYSLFAQTIDNRFQTKCISCPPDRSDKSNYCVWQFTLKD